MTKQNQMHFETRAIHAGAEPDPVTGACGTPIHQAAAFQFKSTQHAANAFALKERAFIYSRLTNPTVSALEEKMTALEGGVGATCTPSGLAANLLIFSALMSPNADFVSSCKIYGGSVGQFRDTFSRAFGWQCHFVDPTDPENFERAITENTRLLFAESISNPEGVVSDLEALGKIAEKNHIPLIIDNTVATPYLCRPFEYGASLVTHSTTKYLSGHGNAMGGVVIDGGTFDWMKHADKYPALGKEVASYNNMIFGESFEDCPVAMHNHAVGLRDLGLNQQPMNAYLTMLGIQTLPLRMEQHCKNALKVAEYLKNHPAVSWVNYTGLKDSPSYALARKYMKNGYSSSLFSFGLKAGYDAAVRLVENVRLFTHLANLGDTRSLIIHPASTTHAQLSEQQKINAGALPDAIRVSIGLENIEDLIADLDQALETAQTLAA
ncbi:MAG: O-acetylhomoserine aminocarboxypropyltransferase [Alphaproteobacteria bacterium CG_4_9_14_3_um_filter_47_13]|nr:MAG: O-acetylhomoserine aminocarboxypropyltransferase [Alphaproteobacteria bacterium CG_4_9_14_3_um_filter_47_13]